MNRFAVAKPMPVEPPVITPTLPASLLEMLDCILPSLRGEADLRFLERLVSTTLFIFAPISRRALLAVRTV
jgi:hypothetical protein